MSLRKGATNIVALTAIQGANALVPVLVFPFALKVLGSGPYALVALGEAVSNAVLACVLYSFEVEGVSRLSGLDLASDRDEISTLYTSVFYARLVIFLASTSLALGGLFVFNQSLMPIAALWFLVPLGYVFHAFWLFQGLENNAPAAFFSILGRGVSVITIFSILKTPADAFEVPLTLGGAFLGSGVLSTLYARSRMGVRLGRPRWDDVVSMLNRGKEIFLANACVVLYRGANLIILGAAGAGASSIAAYSLAEKSTMMLQATTRPLLLFFFPRLLRRLRGHDVPDRAAARLIGAYAAPQILIILLLFAGLAAGVASLSALTDVVRRYPDSARILLLISIMAPATLFGVGNFMFGTAGLNFLHARRYLLGATFVTGAVNVAGCFLLARWIGPFGAAVAFIGSEAILFAIIITKYRKGGKATPEAPQRA